MVDLGDRSRRHVGPDVDLVGEPLLRILMNITAEQYGPIMPVGMTTDCFRFHEKMYTSLVHSGRLADAATMIME